MIKPLYKAACISSMLITVSACGSSQAPWSKPDDSPWGDRQANQSAPEQVVVYEPEPAPVEQAPIEPVAIQPEPVAAAPTRYVDEPAVDESTVVAPAPEAVQAETIVDEMSVEDRVMGMPAGSYAVQVYASTTSAAMARYQNKKDLTDLQVLKTDRGGKIYYVLVDLHADRASANQAAAMLESKIGSKPWVRSVAGLQDIMVK